jgi:hypothetical protein
MHSCPAKRPLGALNAIDPCSWAQSKRGLRPPQDAYQAFDRTVVSALTPERSSVMLRRTLHPRESRHSAGDSLFAFLGDKVVASFNLDLKRLRWSAEASKEWTSARSYLWRHPVLAGDRHELIALRSADGSRAWSFQFPEIVRGIGASPDVLYVGTLKGPYLCLLPKNCSRRNEDGCKDLLEKNL